MGIIYKKMLFTLTIKFSYYKLLIFDDNNFKGKIMYL